MTPKIKPAPVDVVIVGLGANGGTAAKVLSEAGLKVVGLERGPWLKNDKHYSGDELKFVNRNYMWPDSKLTPRTVRRSETEGAEPYPFSMTPQLVGGGRRLSQSRGAGQGEPAQREERCGRGGSGEEEGRCQGVMSRNPRCGGEWAAG